MRVILDITEGPKSGTSFAFDEHKVALFGRSDRCGQYCLGKDPEVSRVHLIMEVNPPYCRVRDLGSTNHTFVNGQRVIEAELAEGDTLRLGDTKLVMRVEQSEMDGVLEEEDQFVTGSLTSASAPSVDSDKTSGPADAPDEPVSCARCGTGAGSGKACVGDEVYVCAECRACMKADNETIPGYRLVSQLAQGGMGIVWLAEDTRTGKQVAVKTMIPEISGSRRMVRMFLRESSISLALRHPKIVEFITAGQFNGQLYVVMEYVEGTNAEDARKDAGGCLQVEDVISIGLQTLEALEYAHSQGIVHRDVKPGNILLQGGPGSYSVKVADYGLARNYRSAGMSSITRQGEVRGSIPYMSIEQVRDPRRVDQRTDVFGLGATMYHLLTGEFAYDFTRSQDPLITIVETEPVAIEKRKVQVPSALAAVVNRAIQKETDGRFQTAREMCDALALVGNAR